MKNILAGPMDAIKADLATEITSPDRYKLLQRKIVLLMALVTLLPLLSLAAINYYEHQSSMSAEIQARCARWWARPSTPSSCSWPNGPRP